MTADVHNLVARKNIGFAKELLQSLVPRAQCFCFYGLGRTCVWSSDGADDYEVDNFVADLPGDILLGKSQDSKLLRRSLPSGRTLLVMPVYAGRDEALGILISVYSKNAGKSSWFNPTLLGSILEPAIRVIGENLRLNDQLARADDRATAAEKELQLVYQVDEKIHGMSRSHAGLAQLLGQSGRFLGIAYSVLLMPSKRIRISATHSSWKSVDRKALDRYLVDTLFGKVTGVHVPVVFEVPAVAGSDKPSGQGYQVMLCPLLDGAGNLDGAIAQFGRVSGRPFNDAHKRFMTHILRKVEYVIEQSFDAMTGLMNRSGFEAQIHESMKSLADEKDAHQLIYFDLDNLQLINDTFGRNAGDEVILRFARLIEEHIPKNAVATRLSDDDFVVLLTLSNVSDAIRLTEAIRKDSHVLRYLQGDRSLQVTVSAGIAELSRKAPAGDALTASRIACESAKDHGRDRYEVHDQENQSIIQRYDDMYLVSEIQKSLDTDAFRLTAQPIVPLAGGDRKDRYEILLRMQDDKGNRVSSESFFSAAERYQLMPQVDRWVITKTLARLAEFADFLEETGAVFAINLSGQSLGDDALLSFIENEMDRTGVPAKSLCFEVTESAAVSSRDKACKFIDALRTRGCRFSLDDFGAGLSSFAYLKSFNVDVLKIDGGFIRDIADNRISESMVAAITQVAKVMELETVAEYVESEAARKRVAELGVDFAQGHATGKPVDLDQVLAELTSQTRISTA